MKRTHGAKYNDVKANKEHKVSGTKKWPLCKFDDLPEWLKDNEYILFGHRPHIPCFKSCIKSIFHIHAETGNIWTHLVGFFIFIAMMASFLIKPAIFIDPGEMWVLVTFFIGAIFCLGFSWTFHAFYCHSIKSSKLFSKLDYCGISLLIMGSFASWTYYAFYCHFVPKLVHLGIILTLGISTISVSLIDKFATPEWRATRAIIFIIFGLYGVCPAVHYIILDGIWNNVSQNALGTLILQGLMYITGASLYATRFPEKWYPGKFDIWFHSHQIFHVFVVFGALFHYTGVYELAQNKIIMDTCQLEGFK